MIAALMPVRNEAWILGLSARAVLMWTDTLVICNHASTDATAAICDGLVREFGPERIVYYESSDPVWREMEQRQGLLDIARGRGAAHVVTVDSDEIVSGNLLPSMRQWVETLPAGAILQLPWLSIAGDVIRDITGDSGETLTRWYYASTGMWSQQFASTAFRDDAALHWAPRDGYDHHHRHPMGKQLWPVRPIKRIADGGLMHLQFASARRLHAKQFLYQLIERKRWPERRMPDYPGTVHQFEEARMAAVPASWWEPYAELMHHLDLDAEPWQIGEAKRLMGENPGIERGLEDFGLLPW